MVNVKNKVEHVMWEVRQLVDRQMVFRSGDRIYWGVRWWVWVRVNDQVMKHLYDRAIFGD